MLNNAGQKALTSEKGQQRCFERATATSGLTLEADIRLPRTNRRTSRSRSAPADFLAAHELRYDANSSSSTFASIRSSVSKPSVNQP